VFALSTLALAFVLYLGWASYFVLKTFCILCAITYVSVIALFIVSGGATTFPMTALPGRARRDIPTLLLSPIALLIALLLAGGASAMIASFPKEPVAPPAAQDFPPVPPDKIQVIADWWAMQPKVELPVPGGGAKVLVVKFSDYQCPACKLTHEGYKDILAKHQASGNVRYVLKHYPLEPECNPGVPNGNHYASCEAAAGVIMARSKGTASKLEDWIFANIGPPVLTPAQVKDAVRTVGGVSDFDAQYATALLEVKTDAGMGQLLKVTQTPTFYINGRKLPEIVTPPVFDLLIELELKQAK
jgi:protein-disulfide isomerase